MNLDASIVCVRVSWGQVAQGGRGKGVRERLVLSYLAPRQSSGLMELVYVCVTGRVYPVAEFEQSNLPLVCFEKPLYCPSLQHHSFFKIKIFHVFSAMMPPANM